MVKKAGDGEILRCSFCNKDQNDVRKLIAGPTVFICDECVEVCNDIIADDNRFENRGVRSALPSPPEIKKFLDEYVIGQEQAKTQAALTSERQRAAEARRALDLLVEVSEQELAERPDLQGVRRRLLETALNYYQDFIESHGGAAGAQAELEAGKKRVRSILDELATIEGANLLHLATHDDVQRDLQLTEDQEDRLDSLKDRSWQQFLAHLRDQRPMTAEARRQEFYELAKIQEAGMSEILQPHQIKRLRQIELQLQGPRAFHDSHAADALKLSADQKRKIRAIKDEAMAAMFPRPFGKGPHGKGPRSQAQLGNESGPKKGPGGKGFGPQGGHGDIGKPPNIEEIHKREVEQILELLTPEQKTLWQNLIGAPFQGDVRMPLPGGFGGPPRNPAGPPPRPPFEPRKDD